MYTSMCDLKKHTYSNNIISHNFFIQRTRKLFLQVLIAGILGYVGAKDDTNPNNCLVSLIFLFFCFLHFINSCFNLYASCWSLGFCFD